MSDITGQPGRAITVVAHRPGCREVTWARFLLGAWAGEVVDDPDRKLVVPYSLIVSDRPDAMKSRALASVRRLGSVGLLHIADKRYRSRLDVYRSFGYVWRTYYHSGLVDVEVRQLPLGPELLPSISEQPTVAARRQPAERLFTWTFAGAHPDAPGDMLEAMRTVEGGREHLVDDADQLEPAPVLELVGDSVFVPCGSDDGHLESPRIYTALELGAIPIVQRRRWLDYFHELFGDHPLPTVRHWSEAPELVAGLLADQTALSRLHGQVLAWWTVTKQSLRQGAHEDVRRCLDTMLHGDRDGTPLERPAPRWRGQVERLRHRALG